MSEPFNFNISIREMMECGVHFGHKEKRWNPKMAKYIYGSRNGIHIIDLQKTYYMLLKAAIVLKKCAADGRRILFVGTKRQGSELIAQYATLCGQNYVNHRWPGGMLTNWGTVSNSIKTLRDYEAILAEENSKLTKKEKLDIARKCEKLECMLGGIRTMGGLPDVIVVFDTIQEQLAIKEAVRLGIPIIAIVDTNASFDGVDYVIPGNDDASKAIEFYCRIFSNAVLMGLQEAMIASGVDVGAASEVISDIAASN